MSFFDHDEVKQLKRIADGIWELVHIFRQEQQRHHITGFQLLQINSGVAMPITGTVVGATSTFQISFVPPTNFIPLTSGPSVAVDIADVTLGPLDSVNFTFTATVSSTSTATQYVLTVTGVNDVGTNLSHVFTIPILPTPPPPPTSITDFDLNQLS
jgi:hypothetical protein